MGSNIVANHYQQTFTESGNIVKIVAEMQSKQLKTNKSHKCVLFKQTFDKYNSTDSWICTDSTVKHCYAFSIGQIHTL